MSKKENKSKRGPGRPATTKWSKANLVWKSKSNAEIARMLGVTPAAVCTKRKSLITADMLAGGDGSKFQPKEGVRYRRDKKETSKKGAEAPAQG